jgi:HSP20 family molecular chaperone IbpA
MFAFSEIFDTAAFGVSYPVPRISQASVNATLKDGVYTATIDAAGADKTKFNVSINRGNELVVSYPQTEGFRCRPFTYHFPLSKLTVSNTEATYVDGVLTVKLTTQKPTDTTHRITVY